MNTVTVSAAVSAVITVVVGSLLNWGERVVSFLRRRIPPNHRPLGDGGGWGAGRASSATDQIRVLVCCAPNRSLRQRDVNPDQAVDFVRHQFVGLFPPEPVFSMPPHGVRFHRAGGVEDGYAWVHASGRIELCLTVPTSPADPGPIAFALDDVIRPVLLVRDAMVSGAYERTFGRRMPLLRRRFDWAIAVSSTVNVASGGAVSWQEVVFAGTRPPRAGTNQQAFCPLGGYASADLRNWPARKAPEQLVRVFLRDFLQQNGFHGVGPAVEDALGRLSQASNARRQGSGGSTR